MWDSLREQVTLERGQLHRLLRAHRPLLEKCGVGPPNDIELSALLVEGELDRFFEVEPGGR